MSDQREDFEEAAARLGYSLMMCSYETGEYFYSNTQDAWNMWQECCDKAARESEGGEAVDSVIGDMVSIDVSTCDEDSGNRVFGKILEWQEPGPDGGRVWLCSLDQFNYSTPHPDKWIPCSERLPTESDGPYVWLWTTYAGARVQTWRSAKAFGGKLPEDTRPHWKPTGLTLPTPPEQEPE